MKKVSALGLLLVSLAACDTTTSAVNTVGSGVASASNAVTSTVASGAAAVTAPVVAAPAVTTAAPVATTTRTTKSVTKAKKSSGKHARHGRVDHNAADQAYMGGGMVVTTPGTAVTVPSGTVVPGTTVR